VAACEPLNQPSDLEWRLRKASSVGAGDGALLALV
jgi:hypothetical protein